VDRRVGDRHALQRIKRFSGCITATPRRPASPKRRAAPCSSPRRSAACPQAQAVAATSTLSPGRIVSTRSTCQAEAVTPANQHADPEMRQRHPVGGARSAFARRQLSPRPAER